MHYSVFSPRVSVWTVSTSTSETRLLKISCLLQIKCSDRNCIRALNHSEQTHQTWIYPLRYRLQVWLTYLSWMSERVKQPFLHQAETYRKRKVWYLHVFHSMNWKEAQRKRIICWHFTRLERKIQSIMWLFIWPRSSLFFNVSVCCDMFALFKRVLFKCDLLYG